MPESAPRLSTWQSLRRAMTSWRTASVSLLSFSSGLPLGLVWIAIPDWMTKIGVDLRVVGLITLAQAPWTFKFLWSPLMDRYVPIAKLGRRRGWAAIAQVALFATSLSLAGVGNHPDAPWVVGALALAIAFAAATQDIAIDAYAVDVLRPEEQGVAVGARTALYRAAMYLAGGFAITLAGLTAWPLVNAILAACYLPMLLITWKAPEPEGQAAPPKTLREAVWLPFLGFLSRHRALEILAFVLLYKFADQLAQTLQRSFLVQMGYSDFDRGVALATVGLAGTLIGVFFGGALTNTLGLGRSLWLFGFLQIFSNLGYVLLSVQPGPNRFLMYGAMAFETLASGMGTGAYGVLLLRLTQKRFSATQYALFSSLFGLPRLVSGPITGFLVHAIGWTDFFWFSIAAGLPGLALLSRFVPWGAREPDFSVEPPKFKEPLSGGQLAARGALGALFGLGAGALIRATLRALEGVKDGKPFAPFAEIASILEPADLQGWLSLVALVAFALVCGLFTAAVVAARHGAGAEIEGAAETGASGAA
ncbi:MAG TPA: MFS transporter [Thermoanaerobaculia bacterium]|nr:MFS transporter [Thermoanaerobaculia bacterium]